VKRARLIPAGSHQRPKPRRGPQKGPQKVVETMGLPAYIERRPERGMTYQVPAGGDDRSGGVVWLRKPEVQS
jgi:hypothetical protein